jgi:WASH complex subunit FAM21
LQAEVKDRITKSLQVGINVLENAFQQVEVEKVEGDSDEDEMSISEGLPEPIVEPIDHYSMRSLPVRIGTPAFFQEDDVGLEDYASDEGKPVRPVIPV